VLQILNADRKTLALTFLIASALSFVIFLLLPKTFRAEAVLLYEGSPVLDAKGVPPSPQAFAEAMIVPARLREVRERLEWDVSSTELEEMIDAELQSETSIVLGAEATNAEEAYDLASTTLDVFLQNEVEFNAKELARLTARNEAALARAKERRDETQEAFDAFREESGRPDLLTEKAQLLARASELRAMQDEAEVEVAANEALIAELEKAQKDLPRQIISSAKKGSVIEGPLARARAELAEARATLSEEHPRVLALKERVGRLEAQRGGQPSQLSEQTVAVNPAWANIDQELATSRAALAAAQERQSALQVLLDDVQREMEALAPEEGEARRVLAEVTAANARVESLAKRAVELRDAALSPITRFLVLSPPVVPERAERSKLQVGLTFFLPFLALLVCILWLLIRALRTLTVRAPTEVAWWGHGPVLGTTIWPRDPEALAAFVDELEDQGVHGGGRTLVVPATEADREEACSFAMKLADAPWLAAAILDVGERANAPMVTPARSSQDPLVTPSPFGGTRRLPADASPSVFGDPIPRKPEQPYRKETVIGLPAVGRTTGRGEMAETADSPGAPPPTSPQPFQRKRGARATVRMVIPAAQGAATAGDGQAREGSGQEQAFLLTRPVPTSSETEPRVGPAVLVGADAPQADASNAVMRAAVRLLGDDDREVTELRRSDPPKLMKSSDPMGVALAWNGPLSGPVLRRAARLAHRVIVVVSSGTSVIDLTKVRTRLGREEGIGYVLINVEDGFLDVVDRVGPVEEFWRDASDSDK
jgi:hypothetical protein